MIRKENSNVLRLVYGLILLLAIVYGTNPPARDSMLTYAIILGTSLLIYRTDTYQNIIIGITKKNSLKSFIFALVFGIGFYVATRLIPGFSFGLPLVPNAISDNLKFIIIVLIAPPAEEIFFRGALLAYIREFSPSKKKVQIAIIISAVLFSIAHVGAYVLGFYNYSTLTAGLSAVSSNISVFISAGIFGYLAGFFVTRDGIRNLLFAIIFHMIVNFIIFGRYTIGL